MKTPGTPLPWKVAPDFRVAALRDMLLNHADPEITEQNAEYIFHACKMYPLLLDLLRGWGTLDTDVQTYFRDDLREKTYKVLDKEWGTWWGIPRKGD